MAINKIKKPANNVKNKATNQYAIAGFVLSFIFFPVGLVLSIIALNQIKKETQPGYGLAVAGCIISGVLTLFTIVITIISLNQITSVTKVGNSNLPPEGSMAYNIQAGAWDAEKETDINKLATDLEIYYSKNNSYPSYADMNSAKWREKANLPNSLDGTDLCDPSNASGADTNCQLTIQPTKGAYSYQPLLADGMTTCQEFAGSTCPKFILTAVLQSQSYTNRNNGSIYYTVKSNN